MKKQLTVAFAALMMGLAAAPEVHSASSAKVAWVYNQVQVTRGGRWVSAGNGTAVGSGAYVRTGTNSRAQIHYADGSVMRLGSRSVARVRNVGGKNVQLHRGKAYFKVRPQQQKMKVRTRSAVATVLGTEFVVEVKSADDVQIGLLPQVLGFGTAPQQMAQGALPDVITQITVFQGQVGVSDPNLQNMVNLTTGMMTLVGQGLPPAPPEPIDLNNFEREQNDLGLDNDNDIAQGGVDPSNPLYNNQVQLNSPGSQGNLGTPPQTGSLTVIIE